MSVRSGPLTPAPPNVSSSLAAAAAAAYDSLGITCKSNFILIKHIPAQPWTNIYINLQFFSLRFFFLFIFCWDLILSIASVGSYNTSRHSPCSPSQTSSSGLYPLNSNSSVPFPSSNPGNLNHQNDATQINVASLKILNKNLINFNFAGLISPGVSVPIPVAIPVQTTDMTSSYWSRLQ